MKNRLFLPVLLLIAGAILLAGCTQPQAPPVTPAPGAAAPGATPAGDTIRVASNPQYGQILTDMRGVTLYYFARDIPYTGVSVCTGTCAANWPPYVTAVIRVSPPLNPADFQEFTRDDGRLQIMYMGWPLHYYVPDTAPGDTKGYGVNGVWYVMSPQGVVTLAPTTAAPTTTPTTARPITVPTTISSGGGYY